LVENKFYFSGQTKIFREPELIVAHEMNTVRAMKIVWSSATVLVATEIKGGCFANFNNNQNNK